MPDPDFFLRSAPLTLQQIANISGARLADQSKSGYVIYDVSSLDQATARDLSFLDNVKYKNDFISTKAGACFVAARHADLAPEGVNILITEEPYKAYALAAQAFYSEEKPAEHISEFAHIHASASIGDGAVIAPGVVIGENVHIGKQCRIDANTVIGRGVKIGDHCAIGANVTISHALIADHVRLYPGVCIGQDGFGFAIDPKGHVKVPQLGRVIIESHVEIGANTTIDRGAGPDTVIGQGTWIDNLVQIGHNVKIGKGCIIVAQVGIAGSVVIEDFVALGGQAGIAGHLTIGKGARIGAQSGVMRDVPAGEDQIGAPAIPFREHMKQIAALKRLTKKSK